MKNSNQFINLICIIPALLILCVVNLKAQNELIGHTYLGTFYDHHYYLSNCGTTWEQANEAAIEMGGYLATNSGGENGLLAMYAYNSTGGAGAWIGLRGEQGIYEWANGEPVNNYYWYQLNWSYPVEPVYIDGAALIGVEGYAINEDYAYANSQDDNYFWKSYPISGEFKYIVEFPVQPNCSNNPNKVYICHNGNTICVNSSALQSHLDHGDLEGPCGPCNTYAMQSLPDDIIEIAGHSLQAQQPVHAEINEEPDFGQTILPSNGIEVFPNPASEEVLIRLNKVEPGVVLEMHDQLGRLVWSEKLSDGQTFTQWILDDRINNGLYFISVISNGDVIVKPLLVTK